ncbi:MAG: 50S ribosomal protein L23 [Oscillospiraceae bacterium]|jgi:large subunit ribosomal protein L23|nr:50S ribosomal protein L23 [Oscillospiraceae bacterium]
MNAYDIIRRPIVTERSLAGAALNKYTFEVANVNKLEIAKAVEAVFPGTKVIKVNTIHVRGQLRRQGRTQGYTPKWKKAVVTLSKDSKTIEIFEGML